MKRPTSFASGAWTLIDQAVYAATNLALTILIARSVSASTFGAFAIAYATYILLTGIGRALTGETSLIQLPRSSNSSEFLNGATGAALTFGLIAGVCVGVAGLTIGGEVGASLAALGLFMPALQAQDTWRYLWFASGRPRQAALNDTLWGVLQFAFALTSLAAGLTTAPWLIAAWGASGSVSAAVAYRQARSWPSAAAGIPWIKRNRHISLRLAMEFAVGASSQYATLWGLALISGATAAGALRGSEALAGPARLWIIAVSAYSIPAAARDLQRGNPYLWHVCRIATGAAVGVIGIYSVVLFVARDIVGPRLLGDTWESASTVLPYTLVTWIAVAATSGAVIGLRSSGAAQASLNVRLWTSAATAVAGILGALAADAPGAAFGMAFAAFIGVPVWWRAFRLAADVSS